MYVHATAFMQNKMPLARGAATSLHVRLNHCAIYVRAEVVVNDVSLSIKLVPSRTRERGIAESAKEVGISLVPRVA